MNLLRLQVFQAVAQHLSYSRAAQELFVSQPAVSKQVRELERELGVHLFARAGRGIRLTEAGRVIFAYARQVQVVTEEARCALRDLEQLERGCLRVAATPGLAPYYLLPALARFARRHPALELEVQVADAGRIRGLLEEGEADLALVGELPSTPSLGVLPLGEERLVVVAAPTHPLATGREDLAAADWLWREEGSTTRRLGEELLTSLGVAPRRGITLPGPELVKRAAAAGLGIALVGEGCVAAESARGELALLRTLGHRPLSLLSRKGARVPAAALAFTALLEKHRPGEEPDASAAPHAR